MTTRKTVYFMRHFEALHNIEPADYSIHDPELSPLGQTQAVASMEITDKIPSIDLIVCSPLKRTLQTYLLVFHNRRQIPLLIHPDIQEVCSEPCDVGSSVTELRNNFPMLGGDLNTFEQTFGGIDWLDKITPESFYSPKRIKERAQGFLQWLKSRSEEHVFVISHNLMLKELLQDNNDQKIDLKNGEIKVIEYQY